MSEDPKCTCPSIQSADASRHFRECPMRAVYPEVGLHEPSKGDREAFVDWSMGKDESQEECERRWKAQSRQPSESAYEYAQRAARNWCTSLIPEAHTALNTELKREVVLLDQASDENHSMNKLTKARELLETFDPDFATLPEAVRELKRLRVVLNE